MKSIESVAIADLCRSSLNFVNQKALKKQIQITVNISPDIKFFEADPLRMKQVLINLLDNAIKFTSTGGKVNFEVRLDRPPQKQINFTFEPNTFNSPDNFPEQEANSWIYFTISDNGIGIATNAQNTIFQPFTQIDSSLNRNNEGMGIGLALVKQIVELHNGCVNLNSQLGKGSCFSVGIPFRDIVPINNSALH